jgi:hypothetical protein
MSDDPNTDNTTKSSQPGWYRHFAWGPFVLTLIMDLMVAWALYHAFLVEMPKENQRVADILLGNIMMAWVGARAFWFNTTAGSQAKDRTIAKAEPVKEEH